MMEPGIRSQAGNAEHRPIPDGKQTRIEFFTSNRENRASGHGNALKKSSGDWWHLITSWLKPAVSHSEHTFDSFKAFMINSGYSERTCQNYLYMVKKFLKYAEEKGVSNPSSGIIEDYNYEFFVSGRYSRSYQLQFINGLSLYLEHMYGNKVNLKGLRKSEVNR